MAAAAAWSASSTFLSHLSDCRKHPTLRLGISAQKRESRRGWEEAPSKWTAKTVEQQTAALRSPAASSRSISVEIPTWSPPKPQQQPAQTSPGEGERMWELVETVRKMWKSLRDGDISVSAYDTAWVARVPALDGSNSPQFPLCLDWIMKNQLEDGSWGDRDLFLTYDRISSTLACAIALKTWKIGGRIVNKALNFIRKTMSKMEMEDTNHMPIGFEIVFPSLIEEAKELDLDIDYEAPVLKKVAAEREKKLQRIPIDVVQNYPTALLHSLEGLHKFIDWEKVIRFQCPDGSLLCSPASTACALMYTGNKKCLQYLNNLVKTFNNAVPNVYPVDLFEHLWMIDRLQRLGIARYFDQEIKAALDYVYKHWTEKGIAWARETPVQDIDDTAMAFRLLRSHGYDVSADVFQNFCKNEEFFCFVGQAGQAVTGMFNLYRASQMMFPGEVILQKARCFAKTFLEEKRRKSQLYDKWIISKDLPGEVEFALDYPIHSSLDRIETRTYIDQYGVDDVWIGKTLYRLPHINNRVFLELAKADYNMCQALHKKEYQQLKRWYDESSFQRFKFSQGKLVQTFFSAAATIFEPELAPARLIWSQCWFISTVIAEYFEKRGSLQQLEQFVIAVNRWDPTSIGSLSFEVKILFLELYKTVQTQSKQGFIYQGRNISFELKEIWHEWLFSLLQKFTLRSSERPLTIEEYIKASSSDIEPAVRSTMYFVGERLPVGETKHYLLFAMMNTAINLAHDVKDYKKNARSRPSSVTIYLQENPEKTEEQALHHVETLMDQHLRQLLQEFHSSTLPTACKQLFVDAVRVVNLLSSIKAVDSNPGPNKISKHVERVLFQPVV